MFDTKCFECNVSSIQFILCQAFYFYFLQVRHWGCRDGRRGHGSHRPAGQGRVFPCGKEDGDDVGGIYRHFGILDSGSDQEKALIFFGNGQ